MISGSQRLKQSVFTNKEINKKILVVETSHYVFMNVILRKISS